MTYVHRMSDDSGRVEVWLDEFITSYADTENQLPDLILTQENADDLTSELFYVVSEHTRNALIVRALAGPQGPPGPPGPAGMA